jgi:hypothetical protein
LIIDEKTMAMTSAYTLAKMAVEEAIASFRSALEPQSAQTRRAATAQCFEPAHTLAEGAFIQLEQLGYRLKLIN